MRPSSVVKNVGALKALLATAVEDGLIPTNPAAPFHPNASGEQAMATAALARLS
jgi:hypothetical protein